MNARLPASPPEEATRSGLAATQRPPAQRWIPRTANQLVASTLERLGVDTWILPAVRVPDTSEHVAFLVGGPTGVFAVDVLSCDGFVGRDGGSRGRREVIAAESAAASRRAVTIGSALQRKVIPVLCVAEAPLDATVVHHGHVVISNLGALVPYISNYPRCLDDTAITVIGHRAATLASEVPAPAPAPARAPAPADHQLARVPDHQQARLVAPAVSNAATEPQQARPAVPAAVTLHTPTVTVDPGPDELAVTRRRRSLGRRLITIGVVAATMVLAIQIASVVSDRLLRSEPRAEPRSPATSLGTTVADTALDLAPVGAEIKPDSTGPKPADALTAPAHPTLSFGCAVPGAGWTAQAVTTEMVSDPVAYHLWLQVPNGAWSYWGQFESGVAAPSALGPLQPEISVVVRLDPTFEDPGLAPYEMTVVTPSQAC